MRRFHWPGCGGRDGWRRHQAAVRDRLAPPGAPRPGALTELLAELVRAPAGAGWELPPRAGELIGRFEIVREIGRGGFGVVYEAIDRELSRAVAFKAIQSRGEEAHGARVVAEAEAAARLAHPNIVHLYDLGRSERGAWLIMELLRGQSLADRLAEGPLPLREAVRVAVELARGLAHAHAHGVVHRDLKPSNVFLCADGQVKVLDFGLAQVFGKAAIGGGTRGYMAPEQEAGAPGDERSDVFSLGKTVAGLVPPGARGTPAALSSLLERMCAPDPAARPASGAEALAALLAIQRTLEPRTLLKASLAVAVLAVAGAAAFAWTWQRPLPEGRLLTALTDTDNQTGDPDLDGAGELLRAGLEQSRRVSVMGRARLVNLLRAAGGQAPAVIDEAAARLAVSGAQAQLLVSPSVRLAAGGFELAVRGVDLTRGSTAITLREGAATKATVPAALERLTARVRTALREAPEQAPRAPVSLADVAPAAPEALRHFADGRRLLSEGHLQPALDAFRRAVAADPEFPLARLEVLEMMNHGPSTDAFYMDEATIDDHIEALRRNLHRLPEKDRAYADDLLARQVTPTGNATEALQAVDRLLEAWPEESRHYGEAFYLTYVFRADLEAVRPYLERALALAPLTHGEAVEYLLALGRLDEALARARRWTEEEPNAHAYQVLAATHKVRGEFTEGLAAARRALALDPAFPARVMVDADALEEAEPYYLKSPQREWWLATRGRVREALAGIEAHLATLGGHPGVRSDALFAFSFTVLVRADPAETWRATERWFQAGAGYFQCQALQLALLGDLDRAWPLTWVRASDHFVCHRLHDAVRTWRQGKREQALEAFRGIATPSSHLYRGEILAELGKDREAVEGYRRYRRLRGMNLWDGNFDRYNYPRSLYLEAVALDRLGERAEARQVLGRLLHLWERADPELPLRRDMLALQARLARAGP